MTRMLVAVIALAVLGFLAYRTLYARSAVTADVEAPTERLKNANEAAKRIEQQGADKAADIEKKIAE